MKDPRACCDALTVLNTGAGAYLTLLNTVGNIGITLPKIGLFALMDTLSHHVCECASLAGRCVASVA